MGVAIIGGMCAIMIGGIHDATLDGTTATYLSSKATVLRNIGVTALGSAVGQVILMLYAMTLPSRSGKIDAVKLAGSADEGISGDVSATEALVTGG